MHARTAAAAIVCLSLTALLPPAAAAAQPSGWSAPWQLESAAIGVSTLSIQPLPGGGALAMWVATPETTSFIAYSTYAPAAGWSQVSYIGLNGYPFSLSLSLNNGGDGVATWIDWFTGGYAFASFYSSAGGFAPPTAVYETAGNNQWAAAAVLDDTGMATLLFTEFNGSAYNPFYIRGSAATGLWTAPSPLPVANGSQMSDHPVVVRANATGAVYALWEQSNATTTGVFASTYTGSWSPPQRVDNSANGVFNGLSLEALADGRAVAAWVEINATGVYAPVTTTFTPGAGWRAAPIPLPVATDLGVSSIDLACSDSGRCAATWVDLSGVQSYAALSISEDAGGAFQPAVHVDPSLLGNARSADVSLTPQGAGVLGWTQSPTPPAGLPYASTFAAEITMAGTLGPTQRLDRSDSQIGAGVSTGSTPDGTRLVSWVASGSMKQAGVATVFTPPDTAAPTLRVTAPLDGAVLNGTSTVVTGIAEAGATVSVNGAMAQVRKDGSFAIRIPLPPGNGTIRVTAWDAAMNNATVVVPYTLFDSTSDLASALAAANLTIVYLTENITTIEQEQATIIANYLILVNYTNALNDSWHTTRDELSASHNESVRAESNATAAHELAHVVQQRLDGTQSQLNATNAQMVQAQTATGWALAAALIGVIAGIAGVVIGLRASFSGAGRGGGGGAGQGGGLYNPGTAKGGEGQGGGLYNPPSVRGEDGRTMDISRQTPKRDFGDRMKAGLDTAGGASPASPGKDPGSMDLSAESESEEEEKEGDEERSASKDHATGLATGKRSAAPRDAASGQATGKRGGEGQGGGIYNSPDAARGPRQSTSVDGSFAKPDEAADAKYGAVAGAHRDDSVADASLKSSAAPRDAATGQATGKRSYEPSQDYLPGDSAVYGDQVVKRDAATGQASGKREPAAPRDAASGQATGKRQATGDLDGDGASERAVQSPRDAASGQASGKRSSMAGEYERDVSAPRDAASGQASGKRAEAPTGSHHDVKAPRDAASGQASGRRAPDGPGGGGAGGSGMAINEQGVAEPPKKKPSK